MAPACCRNCNQVCFCGYARFGSGKAVCHCLGRYTFRVRGDLTDVFLAAAGCVLSGSWAVLTGVNFPGTGISLAQILVGSALIIFGLKLFHHGKE